MIVSITALAATFAPLLTNAQAEVHGAFKPLVTSECRRAQALDVHQAMDRCQQVKLHATKLKTFALEGVEHLTAIRNGEINVHDFQDGQIELLETLAAFGTQSIVFLRDMFDSAERSEMWSAHYAMLKPLKREMLQSLALLRSAASQMAFEIKQGTTVVDNSRLHPDDTTAGDLRRVISKSHAMIGANEPRWL
ncbi:Uncharacterised protein [Serratia fonticola]|jgi:hypothetical protein|uniref:hypothetical protein n=1 Tax=Serratia fonticola TaxID=47917 RepID=UPI000FA6D176|nr:hypothetical protein [Serratia fonticola]CAI2140579.1 Uncharacterised protein [Serratia fonticola]